MSIHPSPIIHAGSQGGDVASPHRINSNANAHQHLRTIWSDHTVGGNQSTQRETTHAQGEAAGQICLAQI